MLTPHHINLINRIRLGFVATVSNEGRPYVSPKGTFIVLNATQLAFAEIRSPQTLLNLTHNAETEVNFVDPFLRKGVRVRGEANILHSTSDEFEKIFPRFKSEWPTLAHRMKAFIEINLTDVKPLSTPPYDDGVSEEEMIALYKEKYERMYP